MTAAEAAFLERDTSTATPYLLLEPIAYVLGTLVLSQASSVLGLIVMAVGLSMLLARKRVVQALAVLLIILILSDSRTDFLAPAKDLRMVGVIILATYSLAMSGTTGLAPPVKWFAPFFVVAVLAAPSGGQTSLAIAKAISYLFVIVVSFQYGARLIRRRLREVSSVIHSLILLVIGVGFVLILIFPDVAFFEGRFRGILGNPDGMGVFVTLALPFELAMLDAAPKNRRATYLWTIAGVVTSGVLCGSRGGLLGMLVSPLARWITLGKGRARVVGVTVLVGLAVGGARLIKNTEQLAESSAATALRVETLATGGGRFLAWAYAVDYIHSAPILGRGLGYDDFVFDEEHRATAFTDRGGHQGGIHNSYLGLLLDTGFLGLLLYLAFMGGVVKSAGTFSSLAPLLAAATLSWMVEGWLVASLNAFTLLFYIELLTLGRLAITKEATSVSSPWKPA